MSLSENFWIYFLASIIAFLIVVLKFCFKSKCSSVKFGCLEITREVEEEDNSKVDV